MDITRQSGVPDVLDWFKANGLAAAELVGRWVWIRFADKPSPEALAVLKSAGWCWSAKRESWYHPCGDVRRFKRKPGPMHPRERYGSIIVGEVNS